MSPPAVTATVDRSSGVSTSKPTTAIVPAPEPCRGCSTSSQPTSRSRSPEPVPVSEPEPTVGSQSSRVLARTSARFLASARVLSVPSAGYTKCRAGAGVCVTSRIVSPYCRAESTVPEKVRSVTRVGRPGSETSSTRTRLCDTVGPVRRRSQLSSTGPAEGAHTGRGDHDPVADEHHLGVEDRVRQRVGAERPRLVAGHVAQQHAVPDHAHQHGAVGLGPVGLVDPCLLRVGAGLRAAHGDVGPRTTVTSTSARTSRTRCPPWRSRPAGRRPSHRRRRGAGLPRGTTRAARHRSRTASARPLRSPTGPRGRRRSRRSR